MTGKTIWKPVVQKLVTGRARRFRMTKQPPQWPENAFAGWQHGYTWNHLWYLAYLWCYTLLLALLQPALATGAGQRLQASFTGRYLARVLKT